MKIEKVALIGAGAVGAYFIWGLSEKMGEHFQVIAEGERKERLRENGIIINGKRYTFPVNTAKDAGIQDLVLIATKYEGFEDAIEKLPDLIGEHTMVISLLNGVNSEEKIGKAIGEEHLIYATMRIASVRKENEIVFPPEKTAGMYYGEPGVEEPSERVKAVEELLEGTGIRCRYRADILRNMWEKYAANVAQNLPQAILGVGYGAYIDSEHVYHIANGLWKEVVAVAKCKGISLPENLNLFRGVEQISRFSTLQDLDAKRHTEIEMFAGNMIEMGAEYGILVPYCEYTYHMIKAMEEKNDGKFEY